jgi:hypothetical protein
MARVAYQRGGRGYCVGGRVLGQGRGDGRGNYPWVGDGGVDGRNGGREEAINPPAVLQHPAQDAVICVILLDEKAMQSWGLTLVGFPRMRQEGVCDATNIARFCAHFGVGPNALSKLHSNLATIMPSMDIKEFFLALSWQKLYKTKHVLAGRWALSKKKICVTCWLCVQKIQELKERKVQWGNFEDNEVFIISVDGVHCQVQEVRRAPGSKWYSPKHHSAGVSYELGIAIQQNQLVWINGPFPAIRHDITIFQSANEPANGLKAKIPVE